MEVFVKYVNINHRVIAGASYQQSFQKKDKM